jgi:hypothetical protein
MKLGNDHFQNMSRIVDFNFGIATQERRPGAARPDCAPHATAADADGNASLRDVQVNSMAVRISVTKTGPPCRQLHCWQPAKSRDLLIQRKIGVRSAPQQVRRLGDVRRDPGVESLWSGLHTLGLQNSPPNCSIKLRAFDKSSKHQR